MPADGHRTRPSGPNAVALGPGMVISNWIADTLGAERLGRAGTLDPHLELKPVDERSTDRPRTASQQSDSMSPSRRNTETDPAP